MIESIGNPNLGEIMGYYGSFLTLQQAAGLLGIDRQAVMEYIRRGELGAVKPDNGEDYRIDPAALRVFILESHIWAGSSEAGPEVLQESRRTRNCMLVYDGKMPESRIYHSIPDIGLECIHMGHHNGFENSIFKGDNLPILKKLLDTHRESIDLVYIDPPFGTNRDYIDYGGKKAYSDKVTDEVFLEFLRKRLFLLRALMSDRGSVYLHIDKKIGHYVKLLMDEVFGEENFLNEITRIKCNPKNFSRKAYGNYSDTILFYARQKDSNIWNDMTVPLDKWYVERAFPKTDEQGRRYATNPLHAPGVTGKGPTGRAWNGIYPPAGRHWRYGPEVLTELNDKGLIEWSPKGNPRKKIYADQHRGKKPQDIWDFKDKGMKYSHYPTEKNEDMLKLIIGNSSGEGSIVLDCFAGSFSTLLAAACMGRKFIGIDSSEFSVNIARERFDKNGIGYNYYEAKV